MPLSPFIEIPATIQVLQQRPGIALTYLKTKRQIHIATTILLIFCKRHATKSIHFNLAPENCLPITKNTRTQAASFNKILSAI